MTFGHAGDLGDIVAAMPTVRALGGGPLFIQALHYTRVKLTPDKWYGLDLLLREQPYIEDVFPWHGQPIDHDLNRFRVTMVSALRQGRGRDTNLADWHLDTFTMSRSWRDVAWLTVEPNRVARVVINRTGAGRPSQLCYHNRLFPWHRVMNKYASEAVFIGTEQEHEEFSDVYGPVPYHKTANLLEAARVIEGADLFIGNQSVCLWICYGLFKRALVEVWLQGQNSSFERDNVTLGLDNKVNLPELL